MFNNKRGNALLDWVDERFTIKEELEKNTTKKIVPPHINWLYCLGGLSFTTFIIQVITGVFLMMYYRPTPELAFSSVEFIVKEVPYGWLIQRVHAIGANTMIVLVMAHMVRVLFYNAYQKPRELHWISGMFLFGLTMVVSFTGYLLPWTQLSYWGATVGTNMPSAMPVIGDWLVRMARGSEHVSGATLTRFFAMHVVALPALLSAFAGWHFVMIRRTGVAGQF